MNKGKFITIEGADGAGKSTHIPFIEALIKKTGVQVVVTREPGGTALGEALRGILLDSDGIAICDDAELLLMFAARKQHLHEVIIPALIQGKWVLCDRFTDATYAYQGGGRNIDKGKIEALELWVQQALQPDLTLLLDVSVEVGLSRVHSRKQSKDRFEQQQQDFKYAVRQSYLDRYQQFPGRIRCIDANQSLEKVQQQISVEFSRFSTFTNRDLS